MTVFVDGFYRNGTVELETLPGGLRNGPVRVAIEEVAPTPTVSTLLPYGKYAPGGDSSLEDFRITEWHGDSDFE